MSSLREIQIAFCTAILAEDTGQMLTLVRGDGLSVERRLQIYRNNNRVGFLTTLQATYPVIERLSGADWFRQSATKYQHVFPSRSGDLQNLGEKYSDFLRTDLEDTEYTYFADVASLEWAYQIVLTAAEGDPVDQGVLRGVAPEDYERLMFVPRAAMRLVESAFPIFAIWRANHPSAAGTGPIIRLDSGPSRVLLLRRADHVELRELSKGTYRLLWQFQLGQTLESAATAAAADTPEFRLDVSLKEALALGTIGEIALHGSRLSLLGGIGEKRGQTVAAV